jgi:hypothetical protein
MFELAINKFKITNKNKRSKWQGTRSKVVICEHSWLTSLPLEPWDLLLSKFSLVFFVNLDRKEILVFKKQGV